MRRFLCFLAVGMLPAAHATGVLNVLLGNNVTYVGTLVAGQKTEGSDVITGYSVSFGIGSLSKTTDYYGLTIAGLAYGSTVGLQLIISDSSNPTQSYFNTLYINGTAYPSSSATYSYSSGTATWTLSGSNPFMVSDSYTIRIVY